MVAMEVELQQARDAAIRGDFAVSSTTREAPVRVAIYDHSPGTANGPKNLLSFLTINNGFDARRVSPEDIRQGVLSDIDVLIMPGGSGSSQAEHLKVEGRKAICDFVDQGGGYVGICAGSYLASSHYEWSLGLINARVWDRAHWARGNGQVRMLLSETGQRALANEGKMLDVYYGQGPLLIPGNNPHLPPYEVLASYGTEIATKGAPRTAMLGTHAIIRASFGKGRVICFSPHPETKTGPNHIMSSSVLWAADKK
ncbi:MAG: biofilm PGA synthesis protein PgaC [Planctomycetales bacterium]|nr:biofilm PGA synthesis protein PgaC [Planctomycetales bacterium]